MSSGIFYNQSVTANDLNEIASDLGAASFNGFGTEKFGAAELNNITKDLVGKGYLNVKNKCKPTVSADGKLTIQSGIIVFSDGAKKVFDEPRTYSFDARGRVIYFKHDIANGMITINYQTSYPANDDYVPLCEVTSDGTLIDKRVFSVAKVNLGAVERNKTADMEITLNIDNNKSPCGSITLDFTGYNGILMRAMKNGDSWETPSHRDKDDIFVTIPTSGISTESLSISHTVVRFERTATGLNYYGSTSWSSGYNDLRLKITLF